MQKRFHLYIRQHANDWYTLSVLTHPKYAVFGDSLESLRDQLSQTLELALAFEQLKPKATTFFDKIERRVLEVPVKAVQHERLITVPMRMMALVYPLDDKNQRFRVMIPRIGKSFSIRGQDSITPWCEEVIRGFFHLKSVDELRQYQYARSEYIEPIDVVYHGARRYRKRLDLPKKHQTEAMKEEMQHLASPLARLGQQLVEEARMQQLPRAHYRQTVVSELIAILTAKQTTSALLIGGAGAGKTAIVHELAHLIAASQVPPELEDTPIWHITGGRVISGMRYLGEWQERCLKIVREIRDARGILFADSLLELQMSGSAQTGMNVAQFLLPFIQSGELRVIVETTPDALSIAEQHGASFVHALRHLPVPSLDADQSFRVLEFSATKLQKQHRVTFSSASIHRALDVMARFGDPDALPGAGLALLDSMARRARATQTIESGDAVRAFASSSGFPEALIDPERLLDVDAVRSFFLSRVIGQDEAMSLLTRLVMVIKSSLNDPEKPLGSFLFMGPTGVGKTEATLALAEYLFGSRDRLIRLDMSEYSYPGSAARLIGGPGGQGDLTGRVRKQPFSVILLDEVEKAAPEVFDLLLQVLGEGRLTDQTGQTVRFRHCTIIMTSNLGSGGPRAIGLSGAKDPSRGERRYIEAAEKFFRPEFVNRIDFLVPFHSLSAVTVREIARRMLDSALAREGFSRRNIVVRYSDDVIDLLMTHGFEPKYGARPMKRAVERHVLVPISRRLVRRAETEDEETIDLYVHDQRVAVASDRGVAGVPVPRLPVFAVEHDVLYQRHIIETRRRVDRWSESWVLRRLREHGEARFDAQLNEVSEQLLELEAYSEQRPSALDPKSRATLLERTQATARTLRALEWSLCMHALDADPCATLRLSSPSPHPHAEPLIAALLRQIVRWCEGRGLQTHCPIKPGPTKTLNVEGAGARSWLDTLIGRHRFDLDDDLQLDVIVSSEVLPEPAAITRHYTSNPETIWDPATGATANIPLDALAEHLDDFILARMYSAVTQKHPDAA